MFLAMEKKKREVGVGCEGVSDRGWNQNELYIKTVPFSPCQKGDGELSFVFIF